MSNAKSNGHHRKPHSTANVVAKMLGPSTPVAPESGLIVTCVDDVERKDIDWLWPSKFAIGKISLIAGDPGVGKSFVTIDIAARVSQGQPWPDGSGKAPIGSVVMLAAEDDIADTIRPRFENMLADLKRVHVVQGVKIADGGRRLFLLDRDLPRLSVEVKRRNAKLVVIDPVSAYLGEIDSHNNAEVYSGLITLKDFAEAHNAAVILVTHLNKSSGQKALQRISGAGGFAGAVRTVWLAMKDSSNERRRLFLPAKSNIGPDDEGMAYQVAHGRVVWEPDPIKRASVDEILNESPAETSSKTQLEEAVDWLQTLLANGPMLRGEIDKQAIADGISERTLWRAKKELNAGAARFRGGWHWYLPGAQDFPAESPQESDGILTE